MQIPGQIWVQINIPGIEIETLVAFFLHERFEHSDRGCLACAPRRVHCDDKRAGRLFQNFCDETYVLFTPQGVVGENVAFGDFDFFDS